MTHGTVRWTELNTHDAEKAMKFYGAMFGWTFDAMPMGDGNTYYLCNADGETAAGIFTMVDPMFTGLPEHWFTYLAVADLGAALSQSDALGGRTMRPPFEIPGFGVLAIVADANGGVMGLIQPA